MYLRGIRVLVLPLAGGPSDLTQLQVRVTVECPHCGENIEYVLANHSHIWRWGLDGTVRNDIARLLTGKFLASHDQNYSGTRPSQPIPGMFVCQKCGAPSFVPPKDKRMMFGLVMADVGHLPSGIGAPWALDELHRFMVKHLEESASGRFSSSFSYKPPSLYHEASNESLLLRFCPCDACEKFRQGDYKHQKLERVHFDLSQFVAT